LILAKFVKFPHLDGARTVSYSLCRWDNPLWQEKSFPIAVPSLAQRLGHNCDADSPPTESCTCRGSEVMTDKLDD